MKFNLIALSAIALCLLQQVQAEASLTSTNDSVGPATSDNTLTSTTGSGNDMTGSGSAIEPAPESGKGKVSGTEEGGLLGGLSIPGLVKRQDLLIIVTHVIDVANVNGITEVANLEDTDLSGVLGNLLNAVGEVLKSVTELVQKVLSLVQELLCEILRLLDIDGSGLGINDLLKQVTDILKGVGPVDLNDLVGKDLDLDVLDGIVGKVKVLKIVVGDNSVLKGLLDGVLAVVNELLNTLNLDSLKRRDTGNLLEGPLSTKRSVVRRNLVKRTIARRAAN